MKKAKYFILTILFGGLSSLTFTSCSDDDDENETGKVDIESKITQQPNSNQNVFEGNSDVLRLEVPRLRQGKDYRFVSHWAKVSDSSSKTTMNFCLEYDSACYHSRWVAFTFNDTTSVRSVGRTDTWSADMSLPTSWQLDPTAYSGSGYTRGHLCASADRLYSTQANNQTFNMSNMSPQLYNFNSYHWAVLESIVQNWAKSATFKQLYVCKGGTIRNDQLFNHFTTKNVEGKTVTVVVPRYYFMAVLARTPSDTFQSIAFVMEQGLYPASYSSAQALKEYAISVDELEEMTGIDFFCNLNDRLENAVEKGCNLDAWAWQSNY